MVGILLGGPGDSSPDGSFKQRAELDRFNQAKVEHAARRTLLALPTDEEGGNISKAQSSSIKPSLDLTTDEGALVRSPKTKNEGPVRSPQRIEAVKVGVRLFHPRIVLDAGRFGLLYNPSVHLFIYALR